MNWMTMSTLPVVMLGMRAAGSWLTKSTLLGVVEQPLGQDPRHGDVHAGELAPRRPRNARARWCCRCRRSACRGRARCAAGWSARTARRPVPASSAAAATSPAVAEPAAGCGDRRCCFVHRRSPCSAGPSGPASAAAPRTGGAGARRVASRSGRVRRPRALQLRVEPLGDDRAPRPDAGCTGRGRSSRAPPRGRARSPAARRRRARRRGPRR